MPKEKMIFRPIKRNSPLIRLTAETAARVYEIVQQTGLTPSQVIEQMLDYIGNDYIIEQ